MNHIKIYTVAEFQKMHQACQVTAQILHDLEEYIKPGISTLDIDNICAEMMIKHGVKSACLGYRGYPKNVCTSVNSVVCHGIPSAKEILCEGDIINVDVTVILDGWYGDSSRMYYVGKKIPKHAKLLCERTYECLQKAIDIVKPGITLGCIGNIIQQCAEGYGYSVVRNYCGHGIGQEFHLAPHVMHHGKPNTGSIIKEGMIFTIEPMINLGKKDTITMNDQWTVITKDRSLSAQYEHCIGVTKDGCVVFTELSK